MPRVMALPSLFLLASFVACGDKVEDSTETGVAVNTPPSANAGVDQTVSADGAVSLDGSGSYDADGDTLTYRWEFEHVPDDSTIQSKEAPFSRNGSAEAATTTFTPDAIGTYVVSLWVSDGEEQSAKDYVVITTQTPDTLPVADAGDDVTVDVDAVVSLDGSGSYDPLGRAVTYAWTIVDTPRRLVAHGLGRRRHRLGELHRRRSRRLRHQPRRRQRPHQLLGRRRHHHRRR
jgi:hypothetical protein